MPEIDQNVGNDGDAHPPPIGGHDIPLQPGKLRPPENPIEAGDGNDVGTNQEDRRGIVALCALLTSFVDTVQITIISDAESRTLSGTLRN